MKNWNPGELPHSDVRSFQVLELPVGAVDHEILSLPLAHVLKVADERAERDEHD